MTGFAQYEAQKGIDAILIADSTLTNMLGDGVNGIVDNGVQSNNIAYPYIVYTSNSSQNFDTQTTIGAEGIITMSIFGIIGDKKLINDIMKQMHVLLHNANVTVDNNDFILCRWDGLASVLVDDSNEGRINHGVIRFRLLTQGQ